MREGQSTIHAPKLGLTYGWIRSPSVLNSGDVTTWTYDNANQLTVEQRSGGSGYTTTYTYDDVGNRATKVDSSGTTTYTYNAGNRLTLITDPSSNLTTNTYDNNGNLTVTNDNGTVTTNTWTYENRLRTVTLATPATTTFTYDGDGLRRQTVTGAGTTNFIWDGQDVLLETDVSNNTQVTYTQTPAEYGDLVSQRRSTTTKYYHFDALGSTLALTDANENVTDTYKYYAFGDTLTSTGSTTNPFQYVGNLGYYNESAISLQYLRARYYQPSTGRFMSVDPIRDGVLLSFPGQNGQSGEYSDSGSVVDTVATRSRGRLPRSVAIITHRLVAWSCLISDILVPSRFVVCPTRCRAWPGPAQHLADRCPRQDMGCRCHARATSSSSRWAVSQHYRVVPGAGLAKWTTRGCQPRRRNRQR